VTLRRGVAEASGTPVPAGYRGAPPRGVDVKPPSGRGPDPGSGGPRVPEGSRRGPQEPSGLPPGAGEALPGSREPRTGSQTAARGVDVKPPPGSPEKGLKTPKKPKIPQNGVLWPFFAIFRVFYGEGRSPKPGFEGKRGLRTPKRGFWGSRNSAPAGVLHQPLAAGPRGSRRELTPRGPPGRGSPS